MRGTPKLSLVVVLSVVYIDMLGIGLAFPVLPKLIEEFEGGDISRASYIYGAARGRVLADAVRVRAVHRRVVGSFRSPAGDSARAGRHGDQLLLLALAPTLCVVCGRTDDRRRVRRYVSPPRAPTSRTSRRPRNARRASASSARHSASGSSRAPRIGGVLGAVDLRLPFVVAAGLSLADFLFAYFALPESLSAENRKPFNLRHANPIGALREIGRYSSVLGLMAIFVMATFANRVAEMTWVLFTSYRFDWGPREIGLSLAMVGVMFVVGQGGLVRVVVPRLGERRASCSWGSR